jgi:hypothetical protein
MDTREEVTERSQTIRRQTAQQAENAYLSGEDAARKVEADVMALDAVFEESRLGRLRKILDLVRQIDMPQLWKLLEGLDLSKLADLWKLIGNLRSIEGPMSDPLVAKGRVRAIVAIVKHFSEMSETPIDNRIVGVIDKMLANDGILSIVAAIIARLSAHTAVVANSDATCGVTVTSVEDVAVGDEPRELAAAGINIPMLVQIARMILEIIRSMRPK